MNDNYGIFVAFDIRKQIKEMNIEKTMIYVEEDTW